MNMCIAKSCVDTTEKGFCHKPIVFVQRYVNRKIEENKRDEQITCGSAARLNRKATEVVREKGHTHLRVNRVFLKHYSKKRKKT